jgi:16S rRNA (cytidine1402-2'-O)-methyltransferase
MCSYSSIGQSVRAAAESSGEPRPPGTLYVVATPIGNLGDMSPRAVQTLRDVTLIAAEDTRHSRRLLAHFGVSTPLMSYHQHNRRARHEQLLAALAGGDVALITDAGTPAISDPGAELVAAALAAGHRVSPVPGPSALAAAVSASGLADGPFVSLGFLPRNARERRTIVSRAASTGFPLVLFESPRRVEQTLTDLLEILGDRAAVLSRELTKVHEEVRSGMLRELQMETRQDPPRGEIVLVVAGTERQGTGLQEVENVLRMLRRSGLSISQTAREAAALTGLPRSELYRLASALVEKPSVGLESELAASNENALQDPLGDQEGPER